MCKTNNVLTVEIESYAVENLEAQIQRLNRRAAKLGLEPTTVEYGEPITHYEWREHGTTNRGWTKDKGHPRATGYAKQTVVATVTTPGVKIEGYKLLGAVDHEQAGNVLRIVADTDIEIPTHIRTDKPTCDHCGHSRHRKTTYLLHETETGKFVRVGSKCVEDFLGHDIAKIVSYFDAWRERILAISDLPEEEFFGTSCPFFDTRHYLIVVSACIREDGWTSRSQARESYGGMSATADIAWSDMLSRHPRLKPTQEDIEMAEKSLEWARSIDENTTSDYLSNLRVLSTPDSFHIKKHLGLIASIPMAYQREVERELRRQEEAKRRAEATNEHIGKVGERFGRDIPTVTARVMRQHFRASDFGTTEILSFLTDDGNTIVWYNSGRDSGVEVDNVVEIKGTIKKHSEFRGTKQTVISRASLSVVGA